MAAKPVVGRPSWPCSPSFRRGPASDALKLLFLSSLKLLATRQVQLVVQHCPAAPRSSPKLLVAEIDFVASAPASSPLDPRPPLRHPVGIFVAALAIKGQVARDEDTQRESGGSRVRGSLLNTRHRRGTSPGPQGRRPPGPAADSAGPEDRLWPSRNPFMQAEGPGTCWSGREEPLLRGPCVHPWRAGPAGPTQWSRASGRPDASRAAGRAATGAPAGRNEGPASSAPNTGRTGRHEKFAEASSSIIFSFESSKIEIIRFGKRGGYSATFPECSEAALARVKIP